MRTLYYSNENRKLALSGELAGWRGTRFWPRVAVKGGRADCIRFCEAVHRGCGAISHPVDWPRYSVRKWPGAMEAIASGYVSLGNWRMYPRVGQLLLAPDEPGGSMSVVYLPGDVMIARLPDGSIHTGVVESAVRAWHCFPGVGVTTCHPANHHTVAIIRAYEHQD